MLNMLSNKKSIACGCRSDARNPGNTLYVTGLSSRVTDRDLEDHFSREGKVGFVKISFFSDIAGLVMLMSCIFLGGWMSFSC